MTSREFEILNIVYKLGGQCFIRTVSKKAAISLDYTDYLSKILLKRDLVKIVNGAIVLTSKGISFLNPSQNEQNESEHEIEFIGISPYLKDYVEKKLDSGEPQFVSSNFTKNQVIEKIEDRSIEVGVRRLTAIEAVENKQSQNNIFQNQKRKKMPSVQLNHKIKHKGRKI